MDSILKTLNAIEQVVTSQLFNRDAHSENERILKIVRVWFTSETKPAIPKDSLEECLFRLDQIVANCSLTGYDHKFLINGFNTLRETINNHFKEKEVIEPQVQYL